MLGTLRDALANVQNEIAIGVERIRSNVAPSALTIQQKCVEEAVDDIIKTTAGGELLLKFQCNLQEMREKADEGARLANLCSTRMGRAQQMCKERADAVLSIDSFLRNPYDIDKQLRDLHKQVDKLQRFCNQTEQALTHLEGLQIVAQTEEEVELIRQQARTASTIIIMDSGPATILTAPTRPDDEVKQKQEEVMLEEFLSTQS
ncbi:unnamed protein product [Auanema sp. JU1783]|nr:unnamed protein product [Auanema sp. JU1783]